MSVEAGCLPLLKEGAAYLAAPSALRGGVREGGREKERARACRAWHTH